MTDKYKVSVIIATYNTALYIGECLDSIFNQTLKDIEVVLIDDGSTDNTAEIIKYYRNRYDNLVTHYQKNQGAGKARNYGITLAQGEYMFFVDPDDKLPCDDCLEVLYNTAKDNNVMICGGNILTINGNRRGNCYLAGSGDLEQSKNKIIKTKNYFFIYGHTRYLYYSKLVKQNQVCYADYKRYQDQVFTIKALGLAQEFYELDYPVYEYRINYKQLVLSSDICLDIFKGFRDILKLICDYKLMLMFERNYDNFIESYMPQISLYTFCGNGEFDQVFGDINNIIMRSDWYKKEYLVTEERITDYKREAVEMKEHLVRILKCGKPVIIYGAGVNTKKLIASYKDMFQSVVGVAVSDSAENNLEIEGFPIRQISDYSLYKDNAKVLVTPGMKAKEAILKKLGQMNFKEFEWIDVKKVCSVG